MASQDFYTILGVPHDVTGDGVKKAYRQLARKLHPDHNPGDAAAEKRFKEISAAYATLSRPEARKAYDAARQAPAPLPYTADPVFDDVFSSLFGGRAPRYGNLEDLLSGPPRRVGPRPGADVQAHVTLPFRDAVEGATVTLSTEDGARITARIPAGVKNSQKIRLRGKGDPGERGGPAGDLLLTVKVATHPVFGRTGNSLTVDLPVTFAEACLGATVRVPVLSGAPVSVRIAAGTAGGQVLRVKGRGVVTGERTGDLLVRVRVVVPRQLSDKAREALGVLRAEDAATDPRADVFAHATER